jgi:transcriptional regulator with XRE-family HTH domain
MGRHRTPEEKVVLGEQARAMRAAGQSRRQICAELQISDGLLGELTRETSPPDPLLRARAKDEHRAAAVALRAAGRTYDEIADELGVSKGSLSLWLRDLPHPTGEERSAVHAELPQESVQLTLLDPSVQGDRRELARQMRLDGLLLREIADALSVTVKTACVWCAGVPTPPRAKHGGNREHVLMMNRKRWDRVLAERDAERVEVKARAAAEVGVVDARELHLAAVVAYWCEGTKDKTYDRRERVTFINSDPTLIRLFLAWLRQEGVEPERWRLSLSIHESADLAAATRYWADVAGVPGESFGRPTLKRHNPKTVRKNVDEAYVGCLVIRVLQSRLLYQRIEGAWRGIVGGLTAAAAVAS